jgi:hypothetical protein
VAHARRFLEWLIGAPTTDPVAPKYPSMLSAWYWNGGASIAARVREISDSGAYLSASERWYPGTILTITFQCGSGKNGAKSPDVITMPCRVADHEQDGMRVTFICAGSEQRKALQRFVARVPCHQAPLPFRRERGRYLVEFGMVVSVVLLLIIDAVNCGALSMPGQWQNRSQDFRYPSQYPARDRTNLAGSGVRRYEQGPGQRGRVVYGWCEFARVLPKC